MESVFLFDFITLFKRIKSIFMERYNLQKLSFHIKNKNNILVIHIL